MGNIGVSISSRLSSNTVMKATVGCQHTNPPPILHSCPVPPSDQLLAVSTALASMHLTTGHLCRSKG